MEAMAKISDVVYAASVDKAGGSDHSHSSDGHLDLKLAMACEVSVAAKSEQMIVDGGFGCFCNRLASRISLETGVRR
ncbi:hypothetical protein [Bradyrhizobium uaiense]|uniref:Uncharacterized protein n=1 Tax=Bradyrhizobium uaiense TaxID=2594946 RepID=A0A6P1BA09_9BRAD|nr:hypothetical protein [Bradyrhizobium uaiense]NEU95238.1 hypothetical protein [Bradyrhizobium uaiense]